MLKKKVLVKSVSNLSDARYCAGMGVDYLCFELNDTQEDYISIAKILEIKKWLSGIQIGGSLSKWPLNISDEDWTSLDLDFLLLNNAELAPKSKMIVNRLILEIADSKSANEDLSEFEHLIVTSSDTKSIQHPSIFRSYQVNMGTIEGILEEEGLKGVSLRGTQELRPGYSNYDDLMDILEAMEEE